MVTCMIDGCVLNKIAPSTHADSIFGVAASKFPHGSGSWRMLSKLGSIARTMKFHAQTLSHRHVSFFGLLSRFHGC